MQVFEYSQFDVSSYDRRKAFEIQTVVSWALDGKYHPKSLELDGLKLQIPPLSALAGDFEGKTFLDLGCGSSPAIDRPRDPEISRRFEPWLCRAMLYLGAKPIGIDIGPLDYEEFVHHTLDLSGIDSLSILETNSVDFANARGFFSSPYIHNKRFDIDPELLRSSILEQLERIVKPNGFFIYNWDLIPYNPVSLL